MTKSENNILLFSITLCWAASYIFIKNLPENLSSYAYLALTTGIAAVVMVLIFFKKLQHLRKSTWIKGTFLSVLLSMNLLAEKLGIVRLSSANASFLSALSIILVPVLLLFFHKRPTRNHVAGAIIIMAGLAVSSGLDLSGFYSTGSLYMLGGCICSAVYTIAVDRFAKEEDPLLLCMVQMILSCAVGYMLWFLEDPGTVLNIEYSREMLSNLFILAFFTKAYAYIILMYSQKYTDAISVTIIASTEPVITLLLAFLLPAAYGGNHSLTVPSAAGAALIAAGAVIAGLSFFPSLPNALPRLRKRRRPRTNFTSTMPNVTVISKHKQFMITLCAMLLLGISFKVMVLVEGLTEIRPVNAIPPVAGLLFGPVGAAACGIGNVLADLAGTFSPYSVLGLVGNFMAAYFPYRLWHLFSEEKPNVHSWKNIALYCWINAVTSMLVAWILSFGLYMLGGTWMENIYTYVFWNELGFSYGLGMPLLILLTSDEIGIACCPKPKRKAWIPKRGRQVLCVAYFAVMAIITTAITANHVQPDQNNWFMYLSTASALLLAGLFI